MKKLEIEAVLAEAIAGIGDDEQVTMIAIFISTTAGARIFTDLDAGLVPGMLADLADGMAEQGGPKQMH